MLKNLKYTDFIIIFESLELLEIGPSIFVPIEQTAPSSSNTIAFEDEIQNSDDEECYKLLDQDEIKKACDPGKIIFISIAFIFINQLFL